MTPPISYYVTTLPSSVDNSIDDYLKFFKINLLFFEIISLLVYLLIKGKKAYSLETKIVLPLGTLILLIVYLVYYLYNKNRPNGYELIKQKKIKFIFCFYMLIIISFTLLPVLIPPIESQPVEYDSGESPDLIAAVGENGIEGYIKSEDLLDEGDFVQTPEEAIEYSKKAAALKEDEVYREIPLYKSDGETIIGKFRVDY